MTWFTSISAILLIGFAICVVLGDLIVLDSKKKAEEKRPKLRRIK